MTSRSGWSGRRSVLFALVFFALFGLAGCDEDAAIVVRPVELVDPAPEDPFDLDPLLSPSARREGDSSPGRERSFELAGGDVVTVRIGPEPALVLGRDDVAFLELGDVELGDAGLGEVERHAVYAVLDESGRAAWAPFAAEHANTFSLVEIQGRPVDLIRPLGWTRGLRIGIFADEPARARFLETLPFAKNEERGARPDPRRRPE